jgi:tRNA (cytidine/uridine-2'-O-)-methyltransferase
LIKLSGDDFMINVVLYEPEIPQNTGNIMRTCVATNSKLHLIKPLGFKLDDSHMKRSAVNYLENLNYEVYENFEDFKSKNKGTYYYLTRYGKKPHTSFDYSNKDENIYLIFGKESTGIPKEILSKDLEHCMRIPMTDKVRALNVSNSVAIMLYEVLRQQEFRNLLRTEPFKGEDYLEEE